MEYISTAFAAIFLLLGTACGLQNEERCQTPDRARGTCIGIRKCPLFAEAIKAKPIPQATQDLLSRSQCGFQGRDPLICCPSNSPVALQTTATTNTEVTEDVSKHRNLGLLKTDICGPIADDRIINGNRTKVNEMPWMALVAYNVRDGSPFGCGGTIINDRYVLTAAHCVKFLSRGHNAISVRLGEHDLDSEIDCEEEPDGKPEDRICAPKPQDIRIEEIVVHPRYTGKSDLQDDIALIRLKTAVDFSSVK